MSRTILALVLLVAITAALQLGAALQSTAIPTIACGLCHDGTALPISLPASSAAAR
jgi:hypothetical protein